MRAALLLLVLVFSTSADASPGGTTSSHLRNGVSAFQAADYPRALQEFEAVARAADAPPDLAFYLGPTLYKLGRFEDALTVFIGAGTASSDLLARFYLGQTYYQLRLYRKAREVFKGLRERGLGPRLGGAADTYVGLIDRLYDAPPADSAIAAYLASGQKLLGAGKAALAAEYLEEARLAAATDASSAHRAEIVATLAAAWNQSGRPRDVVTLVGGADERSGDAGFELARAYIALGDRARGRRVLESLVQAAGPRAAEARALLDRLPP